MGVGGLTCRFVGAAYELHCSGLWVVSSEGRSGFLQMMILLFRAIGCVWNDFACEPCLNDCPRCRPRLWLLLVLYSNDLLELLSGNMSSTLRNRQVHYCIFNRTTLLSLLNYTTTRLTARLHITKLEL